LLNKIRNPNIEIRNKPEAKQKPTPENPKTSIVARARFEVAVFGSFEFVSSFEIRIWDFYRMTLSARASTLGWNRQADLPGGFEIDRRPNRCRLFD
jgi:hypothetical protein